MRAFTLPLLLILQVALANESSIIVDLPPLAAELVQEAQSLASRRLDGCFRDAYSALVSLGCKQLHEHGKRRLALMFSNCHLSSSGRPTASCDFGESLEECGSRMSSESFSSYTSFTTHVDALCYYLESSQWQAATWDMVHVLLTGANETAQRLTLFAADIQSHQAAALSAARELALRQEAMGFQLASTERRVVGVVGVLDRVAVYAATAVQLQGYVVGNLLILHVALFYAGTAGFVWLFTSARRTAGARLTLLAGLVLCALAEAYIATHRTALASIIHEAVDAVASFSSTSAPEDDVSVMIGLLPAPHSSMRGSTGYEPPLTALGLWAYTAARRWTLRLAQTMVVSLSCASLALYRSLPESISGFNFYQAPPLFDAVSGALWDLSCAQVALRWSFMAWAAVVLVRTAAAYVEYGRESLEALRALQQQVARLASEAAASSSAAVARVGGPLRVEPRLLYDILGSPLPVVLGPALEWCDGGSPATDLGTYDNDDSDDGDYIPYEDGADAGASAAEFDALALADFAEGLPLPHLAAPPLPTESELIGSARHAQALALPPALPPPPPFQLTLRPRLPLPAAALPPFNPVLAFVSPEAFAQLVELRRLGALLGLRNEAAAARGSSPTGKPPFSSRSDSDDGGEEEEEAADEEDSEEEWPSSEASGSDGGGGGDSDAPPSPGSEGEPGEAGAAPGSSEWGVHPAAGVFPSGQGAAPEPEPVGSGLLLLVAPLAAPGYPPAPALAGQRRRREPAEAEAEASDAGAAQLPEPEDADGAGGGMAAAESDTPMHKRRRKSSAPVGEAGRRRSTRLHH